MQAAKRTSIIRPCLQHVTGLKNRKIAAIAALWFASIAAGVEIADAASDDWRVSVIDQVEKLHHVDDANALQIGRFAEIGFQEINSSRLLQERLRNAGFDVKSGVAGMPTAFIATYGKEGPVVGFLAEYDALAGFSQTKDPVRTAIEGKSAGHACGHNLLGSGAVLAAVATKEWITANNVKGIIKVFGTPAEEGGGGKVYFARDGLLDGVDVMMNWHPDSYNGSITKSNLAMIAGKFRFYGYSTHASAFPQNGRSALDGVEAMNMMANMMREHIEEKSRIHYAITQTNKAPNVIPDFAEVFYFVRNPEALKTQQLWERVVKAAEGAALGTGTTVEHEIISGHYGYLANTALARVTHANMLHVGGVEYSESEITFARNITKTFPNSAPDMSRAVQIQPLEINPSDIWTGSSDVGDVSWLVPTNWVRTATYVPGTSAHSWQSVAASNTSIGLKGMHVAAKTMALTAVELMKTPELLDEIRTEFDERRGPGYKYVSLIGERSPPLDYMK